MNQCDIDRDEFIKMQQLIYWRNIRRPLQVLGQLWASDNKEDKVKTTYDYVINLRDRLETTMKIVTDNIETYTGS